MSNILKVLVSRALFHETTKQRERLEKEIREKRETERIDAIKERKKYFFSITNLFGVMALICALVGFVLKLRSYFGAKKHFVHCKDIIKASLF